MVSVITFMAFLVGRPVCKPPERGALELMMDFKISPPMPCLWQGPASTQKTPKGNQTGHSPERAVEGPEGIVISFPRAGIPVFVGLERKKQFEDAPFKTAGFLPQEYENRSKRGLRKNQGVCTKSDTRSGTQKNRAHVRKFIRFLDLAQITNNKKNRNSPSWCSSLFKNADEVMKFSGVLLGTTW